MIKTHTCCKTCIFAMYEGKTQTSCILGKLEKFEENGNEIVECYDEEKNFYVVDGRKCQFFRTDDWLANISYEDDEFEVLQKEVQIGVDIILLVKEGQTFEDIKTSILSIEKSTIKPESIIIVLQNVHYPKFPIDHNWIKSNTSIPYSIEYVIPEATIEKCINIGAKKSSIYYVCLSAGLLLEEDFIQKINDKINSEMWNILYISGIDNIPLFVNKSLHNLVGGFGKRTLHDKVLDIQKEDKCKNTFLTYEQI